MGQTPSDRLDAVADVAAAIEAAGNEITDLRVTVDGDSGRGTAQVTLPIVAEHEESPCEFDLVTATLADGTLRVELAVATETPAATSDDPAAPAAETPDEGDAVRPGGGDQSTPLDADSSGERETRESPAADSPGESTAHENSSSECGPPDPGATERAAESTSSEAVADSDAPASDGPPAYRDPDQLAAVYDAEATFPEMTDALGVEVTPQTVRKYMIEHGIHEPASRTSDALAQTDTDADEVTGVEETDPERDAKTGEPAAGESHHTAAETTPATEEGSQRSSSGVESVTGDEPAAGDAPDQAATVAEPDASDTGGGDVDASPGDDTATTTAQATTEPSGDETDDTATDPPAESAADATTTASTATDGGTQPTLSAVEAVELPDEVSVAELVSVLSDSRTVYEVRRGLGIDDRQTRALLRRYNLIDLVTGRITQGSESPDRQEVLSRLSEATDRAA
ncbi:hypothetical protein EXE43_11900 [Halorubrum sp. SS5]|nr:hypothetical protein EXE43_11900 [Halorubrum sp. SS5]